MNYKCLALDHDDTVVKSTPEIHYPSFVETLSILRPDVKMSLEDFYLMAFEPGFEKLLYNVLHFSEAEMQSQLKIWQKHVNTTVPSFFEGVRGTLRRFKEEGGQVAVITHSLSETVYRDYKFNDSILPDAVFGWELGSEKRKPNPYPLQEIARRFDIKPSEILVVDDLKPGYDMAVAAGCDFVMAGWSHDIKAMRDFSAKKGIPYLESVAELEKIIF